MRAICGKAAFLGKEPPFVFTEYGAIQAANVLRSRRAIEMSLYFTANFDE